MVDVSRRSSARWALALGLIGAILIAGCQQTPQGLLGTSAVFDASTARTEDIAEALQRDGRVMLRGVLYEFESARLSDAGQQAATRLAGAMIANPGLRVAVVGHTDSTGRFSSSHPGMRDHNAWARCVRPSRAAAGVDQIRSESCMHHEAMTRTAIRNINISERRNEREKPHDSCGRTAQHRRARRRAADVHNRLGNERQAPLVHAEVDLRSRAHSDRDDRSRFFAMLMLTTNLGLSGAVVLGGGLALSSTAIVVHVLSEKGDTATEHGRASFAVLVMQDLAALPMLIPFSFLSFSSSNSGEKPWFVQAAMAAASIPERKEPVTRGTRLDRRVKSSRASAVHDARARQDSPYRI